MKRFPNDLSGLRFGKLVVENLAVKHGLGKAWLCKCDCGGEVVKKRADIISKGPKSCGCEPAKAKRANLQGKVFGKLTAIGLSEISKNGETRWTVLCLSLIHI